MRSIVLGGLLLLGLSGCITKAVQDKELAESGPKDDAYCRSIGARPGSSDYTQCRLVVRQQLLTQQAETRRRLDDVADSLAQAGRDMQRKNVNCTSTQFGSTINTSCY